MNEFETTKAWLKNTYNIGVSSEWLAACLEWIQQENQGHPGFTDDLLVQVFQQWLMSDLTEIGEPVLPQNVSSAERMELISNYPLQMNSVVDVGFPLYGQKQKLKGQNNPNEEVSADKPYQPAWEPKPSRMLLLHLTDGHTHIQAMEYRHIQDLHTHLPSGLKILVSGSVLCRRGIILLTPECVQVLGGEVDVLSESNNPLSNIEHAMERNRQDEGKHTKQMLSGKFITRGMDKKSECMQMSFSQTRGGCRKWEAPGPSGFQIKKENLFYGQQKSKHVPLSTASRVKTELKQETQTVQLKPCSQRQITCTEQQSRAYKDIKNTSRRAWTLPGKSVHGAEQIVIKDEDFTMDSDVFDDEMDLDAIDALDSTSATTCPREKHISPGLTGEVLDRHNNTHANHRNMSGARNLIALTNAGTIELDGVGSFRNQSKVDVAEADDDLFDDDFEIDDVTDPTLPDNMNVNENQQSLRNSNLTPGAKCNNKFSSEGDSPTFPYLQEFCNRLVRDEAAAVSLGSQSRSNTMNTAPDIQQLQDLCPSKLPVVSSVAGTTSQTLQRKTPLFKDRTNTVTDSQRLSGHCAKPKTQCKLSNMFFTKSDSNTAKHCPSFANPNSFDEALKSRPSSSSSNRNSTVLHSSNSALTNSTGSHHVVASDNIEIKGINCVQDSVVCGSNVSEAELDYEDHVRPLPRAVIHPYMSTSSCDTEMEIGEPRSDICAPYGYLSSLEHIKAPASLVVKVYIATLTDKLNCCGGVQWSLSCRINDGTASVEVELDNNVLTELIGFSAPDCVIMKQRMKTDSQLKEVVRQGLAQCQQKLINICCLMEVEILPNAAKPRVKKLMPVSKKHIQQLLMRVKQQTAAV